MALPLVVGLGQATVDFLGAVPRLPEPNTRTELGEVSLQLGGAAATATATAAALGCRARFAGKIADDFLGRYLVRGLREADVDAEYVVLGPGRLSPFAFTVVGRDSGARTTLFTAGDVGALLPGELALDRLVDGAKAVLLDGYHPDAQCALAELARDLGIPVVLDTSLLSEGFGELVELTDVLIASERFASEVAPRGELQDSLTELQRLGPNTVIITMGDAGSVGLRGDQLVRQPAFATDVVDASGAGEVYHGAFVAAMVAGRAFAECMEFASAAAAHACRTLGPWAGIPDHDDVRAVLDAADR